MQWLEALKIQKGMTCIIGSGGKTTLLSVLARECHSLGMHVVLTTSTHIYPFAGMHCYDGSDMESIREALSRDGTVCVGMPAENGKLKSPACSFSTLCGLADMVLVEADGSKGLPVKAHAGHEPVIPEGCGRIILVTGAQAAGKRVKDAVHRPEIYTALTGQGVEDIISPSAVAKAISREKLCDMVLVNHCETEEEIAYARELMRYLALPALAGTLREDRIL